MRNFESSLLKHKPHVKYLWYPAGLDFKDLKLVSEWCEALTYVKKNKFNRKESLYKLNGKVIPRNSYIVIITDSRGFISLFNIYANEIQPFTNLRISIGYTIDKGIKPLFTAPLKGIH